MKFLGILFLFFCLFSPLTVQAATAAAPVIVTKSGAALEAAEFSLTQAQSWAATHAGVTNDGQMIVWRAREVVRLIREAMAENTTTLWDRAAEAAATASAFVETAGCCPELKEVFDLSTRAVDTAAEWAQDQRQQAQEGPLPPTMADAR